MSLFTRLATQDRGANLAEWGILVSLIAIIAILAVTSVGEQNSELFSEIGNGFP